VVESQKQIEFHFNLEKAHKGYKQLEKSEKNKKKLDDFRAKTLREKREEKMTTAIQIVKSGE
jgi:hypothetical protein